MRLLTFSICSLRRDGVRWVRLGSYGPGIRIWDLRGPRVLFSIRNGLLPGWRILGRWFVHKLPRDHEPAK